MKFVGSKLIICALIGFFTVGNPALAAVPSEDEIIKSVKEHYPVIQQSYLQFDIAKYNVKASQGAFDAKVYSGSFSNTSGNFTRRLWDARVEKPLKIANSKISVGSGYGYYPSAMYRSPYDASMTGETGYPIRLTASASLVRNLFIDENRARLRVSKELLAKVGADKYLTELIAVRDASVAYWS